MVEYLRHTKRKIKTMKRFKRLLIWLHILRPKIIYNALSTGIMCRFYDIGGEIKVTTNTEYKFIPYIKAFSPLKYMKL